jgi:hypothetical protein
MANQLSEIPWAVDTAGGTVLYSSLIKVAQFSFLDYAAGTDTVEVQDRNGNLVWKGNGTADLNPIDSGPIGWIDGLKVPTLSAGKLLIYVE